MPLQLSRRCETVLQSEIRNMSVECEKVGGLNLSQGVCDTPLPDPIRTATHEAIDQGVNSYTRFDGLSELRQSIARKLKDYNQIVANPDTEIIVSSGSTGAFYSACMALLDPGDEVILFEPYYGYHLNTLNAVQAVPAFVRLNKPDWTFAKSDLERAITQKTKAIVINTPANPSGKVFSRTELEWIADIAQKWDIFVFTDEIYEYFLYDHSNHISPATLPGLRDRTITISGFSKTFSITGWRIGYSASIPKWAQMIGYMSDLVYVCAPSPLQMGVAQGMERLSPQYYKELRLEFKNKREKICDALSRCGLTPYKPQGAYYVLADISRLPGKSGKEKVMFLLNATGIAAVPGEAFFHCPEDGVNLARFCYAKTDEELDRACASLNHLTLSHDSI